MTLSRLRLGLEAGVLAQPDGGWTWINAPGDADPGFTGFTATQSFFPDHAKLTARGVPTVPEPQTPIQNAIVSLHRSKPASLELIAKAFELTEPGGLICIDGDKSGGIDSIAKQLKSRFETVDSYAKAHGKLLWLTRPETLPYLGDWQETTYLHPNGWVTRAGVFSADGPDAGSKALAPYIAGLKGRVAELGSGWGYLCGEILKSASVTDLLGIEADYHALACAKHNIRDTRATFQWDDVTTATGSGFDAVVTNPPFHTSRTPDPSLGIGFIKKAADMLSPKGTLWMVANRNLPYEATLEECFRKTTTHAQTGGFKVIEASVPKNTRTR